MTTGVVIHHAEAFMQSRRAARKLVLEVLREVEAGAKTIAATGEYATGQLADSIHRTGPTITRNRVSGRVGSSERYAAAVESGAVPHRIFPRPPRTYLKFFWRKVGRVVYLDRVSHPGMKGKHYLEHPLRIAAARHNMRVVETRL
jgi:hypothetical protein